MVVAIDGPAGAGKTTVARGAARRLGYRHLDTGSIYRALTARALELGVDPRDAKALEDLAKATELTGETDGHVHIGGTEPRIDIRSPEVNAAVSEVSAHPGVRRELLRVQRAVLANGGVVAEGRDIGTVVWPQADVKVFLTASLDERARRRAADLAEAGARADPREVGRAIATRDRLDSSREASPLTPAEDAVVLDTTDRPADAVIDEIVALVRERAR